MPEEVDIFASLSENPLIAPTRVVFHDCFLFDSLDALVGADLCHAVI
jgi:hypothetical protein